MGKSYRRKHGVASSTRAIRSRSSSRPTCFGDAKVYDLEDPGCVECKHRTSCRVRVKLKAYRTKRDAKEEEEDEDTEESEEHEVDALVSVGDFKMLQKKRVPWSLALAHNGFLRMASVFFTELNRGIRSIPLVKYSNPFQNVWDLYEDEDEEDE